MQAEALQSGGLRSENRRAISQSIDGKVDRLLEIVSVFSLVRSQVLNSFQVWNCNPKRIFIEINQKMKTIIALAVALFLGSKVSATAQYPDKIIWR